MAAEDQTADGAPAVNLLGNTLTGNTIGLTVGTVAGDTSAVTAQFNNIFDNLQGVDANQNPSASMPASASGARRPGRST